MSEITSRSVQSNFATFDRTVEKLFLFENDYISGTFLNNTGATIELVGGEVIGRVAASGKLVVLTSAAVDGTGVGLVYYQAGIVVLTASVFDGEFGPRADTSTYTSSVGAYLTSGSITGSCDGLRNRIQNIQFNNTTELNSTVYFCRANHNEFNYSSNPTYVSGSKIVVKNFATDPPLSYITTIGLYSADNELLAVAKVSEPLKKTIDSELTVRVRLDY